MYKVIVVEDKTMVRRGIIPTIDWTVLDCVTAGEAASGEEGAELAVRPFPDIIVTDVKMPRMNGVEMITKLQEQDCRVRFIILTAYSGSEHAQSALRLGASDCLLKSLRDGDSEHAVGYIRKQMEERPPGEKETGATPVLHFHFDKKSRSKHVEAATRYVREHYREDIIISTVVSFLEISEGYLSKAFRKETDYTSTNYLAYYRMQMAMSPLKGCRVKVCGVTGRVGYSDTTYFSAQFKRILGVSPSEYQGRCRQLQQSGQIIMNRKSREKYSTIH